MVRSCFDQRIRSLLVAGGVGLCLGGGGCAPREEPSYDPARVPNAWLGPASIAVAPALNFSGASVFDAATVADFMASELGHVEGINVIPVSRVLAAMARMGVQEVGSPEEAREIRELTGADAILVFAVTEYDPYDPPIVGIAAQLYGRAARWGQGDAVDPVLVSRQARPLAVGSSAGGRSELLAQAERVYNASHEYVVQRVRRYAELRGDDESAFGWRLYLVSQEHYLRFCCSAVIEELVGWPAEWSSAGSNEDDRTAQ